VQTSLHLAHASISNQIRADKYLVKMFVGTIEMFADYPFVFSTFVLEFEFSTACVDFDRLVLVPSNERIECHFLFPKFNCILPEFVLRIPWFSHIIILPRYSPHANAPVIGPTTKSLGNVSGGGP
jgi:hypothetical protein